MSLILEALRKLERDKDAPERGFVVVSHMPWAKGGDRSRLVGIGALALALAVGALALALWRGRSPKPARPEARAVATVPPSAAPTANQTSPPPPPFEAKALARESLPTSAAPPASASAPVGSATPSPRPSALPELRLSAISRRDDQPVAILNDRLVKEGDVFDGIRVIRIGETEVEVEFRGQRRVLAF